jgi:hypothetical protein
MPKGVFWVGPDKDNPRDIRFQIASQDVTEIPEDQLRLRDEVDRALMILRMLFPDGDSRFNEYFRPMLSLAQAGLVGDAAEPKLASGALEVLKSEITAREGGRIKNQYMKNLGVRALLLCCPVLIAALLTRHYYPNLAYLPNFLFLWSGCMVGVWLSFGARKTFVRFEDLHIPEEDRLEPVVRLFFAGCLTIVIGLLFSLKALVVTFGAISTEQINNSVRVALLIGLLGGVSEQVLSTAVAKQASHLLDFGKK